MFGWATARHPVLILSARPAGQAQATIAAEAVGEGDALVEARRYLGGQREAIGRVVGGKSRPQIGSRGLGYRGRLGDAQILRLRRGHVNLDGKLGRVLVVLLLQIGTHQLMKFLAELPKIKCFSICLLPRKAQARIGLTYIEAPVPTARRC